MEVSKPDLNLYNAIIPANGGVNDEIDEQVQSQLSALKMKGIAKYLDQELNEAESGKISYTAFLKNNLLNKGT